MADGNWQPVYDVDAVRADFPILAREIYGRPLVYLDSAASAQKPRAVIDSIKRVYEEDYANVHRGAYYLSQRATDLYERLGYRRFGRIEDYYQDGAAALRLEKPLSTSSP